MIQEIFKEKIAEQRLIEEEAAEKAKKKELELATVLEKAEKNIQELLEKAPPSAFKIPKGALCAVVIKPPLNETKGDFTKEYSVFTGYKKGGEDEYRKIEKIGDIKLQFESVVNGVDFSNMFKNDATLYKDNSEASTLFFFVFNDSETE